MTIRLTLGVTDPNTLEHLSRLARIEARDRRPDGADSYEIAELTARPLELFQSLQHFFSEDRDRMAVLISDCLVPPAPNRSSPLLTRFQEAFGDFLLGTIAITANPQRIQDVDRTLHPNCTEQAFQTALNMVIGRLRYISMPKGRSESEIVPVVVRGLRLANETELYDYFRLRHQVYTIMGYLDEDIEKCRSKLEINEADLHAVHVGAFVRDGPREALVGTARVVMNVPPDIALTHTLEKMVVDDPIARHCLETPYWLGLPIFQTHRQMNSVISEICTKRQTCGELSRVIVAPSFRGLGVSQKLIEHALRKSLVLQTKRVFLECLNIHARIYEKCGFQIIPGVVGPVVDVGRTMIAMEMRQEALDRMRSHLTGVA